MWTCLYHDRACERYLVDTDLGTRAAVPGDNTPVREVVAADDRELGGPVGKLDTWSQIPPDHHARVQRGQWSRRQTRYVEPAHQITTQGCNEVKMYHMDHCGFTWWCSGGCGGGCGGGCRWWVQWCSAGSVNGRHQATCDNGLSEKRLQFNSNTLVHFNSIHWPVLSQCVASRKTNIPHWSN